MKKQLSLLMGSLILVGCSAQPQPLGTLPQQQVPQQQVIQQVAQPVRQTPISVQQPPSVTQQSTTQRRATQPTRQAVTQKTASTTPVAPSPSVQAQQPKAQQPKAQSTNTSLPTPKQELNIAENYNTMTLLAGLRSEADLSEAKTVAAKHNLKIERFIPGINTLVFHSAGQNVPMLLKKLAQEPVFLYVETDNIATQKPEDEKEVEDKGFSLFSTGLANDTYYEDQYGLTAARIPQAWNLSQGDNVVVSVIDTGVDLGHKDLKGHLVDGYDAYSRKWGPKEGDVSSLNYIMSNYKHGTHVAGIIAAETNNARGIAGVAPHAKIMPVKIFPDVPDIIQSFFEPDQNASQTIVSILADGIIWSADNGADIINMSLAVYEQSTTLERAVAYAREKGVTIIVAAGNERHVDNKRNFLAAIEGVIGVGATNNLNAVSFFSNSGDYVDVAAPGQDIISSVPSFLNFRSYVKMSGTSMAAPHVAGVAALLKSKFGDMATPDWIQERLESTAEDLGDDGRDDLYGHGLINAMRALTDPVNNPNN